MQPWWAQETFVSKTLKKKINYSKHLMECMYWYVRRKILTYKNALLDCNYFSCWTFQVCNSHFRIHFIEQKCPLVQVESLIFSTVSLEANDSNFFMRICSKSLFCKVSFCTPAHRLHKKPHTILKGFFKYRTRELIVSSLSNSKTIGTSWSLKVFSVFLLSLKS